MRKEPNKYITGGGLNPIWVEWDMERYRRENPDEYCYTTTSSNISNSDICEIVDLINNFIDNYCYDCDDDMSYEDKLEADFQFLKKHSNSEEDLKLAKQILGIDVDDE